jgi:hypothetical protein
MMHARAVRIQHTLDLVECVFALRDKIAVVADVAARTVLVFGAHAGEEDKLPAPRPFTVTASEKMPLVQALWVNSFFSYPEAAGCCAAAGTASAATIAAAMSERGFRMGPPRSWMDHFNRSIFIRMRD